MIQIFQIITHNSCIPSNSKILGCDLTTYACVQEFRDNFTRVTHWDNAAMARDWRAEYNRHPEKRASPLHLIGGSVLPLMPTLDRALGVVKQDGGRCGGGQIADVARIDFFSLAQQSNPTFQISNVSHFRISHKVDGLSCVSQPLSE